MVKLHIGIDDTDSVKGGCTTYIAALLVERLYDLGVSFIDYPNLIRLNPNVPWKTRGNGAVCLRVESSREVLEEIKGLVVDVVEANSDLNCEGTDPGVVFLEGVVPEEVRGFAERTIRGLVEKEDAIRLIRSFKAEAVGFKDGRGIIGGLAAIGELLNDDYTFEFIAYRMPEMCGKPRRIRLESVFRMDEETKPLTFNNIDPETGRVLITPRGPDPVLYGVRGESPQTVKVAGKMIVADEPVERWMIFRTNQGTDAHLRRLSAIREIKPYNPVIVSGTVSRNPVTIRGGHVIFSIRDGSGEVDCAAYEETGELRDVARMLRVGDWIEVMGGVRPPSSENPLTVNVEKLKVMCVSTIYVRCNPQCPRCCRRMESMGRNKGFRCRRCGFKDPKLEKVLVKERRDLKAGIYVTSPRSQRHLTKPLSRYGLEKDGSYWGSSPINREEFFWVRGD